MCFLRFIHILVLFIHHNNIFVVKNLDLNYTNNNISILFSLRKRVAYDSLMITTEMRCHDLYVRHFCTLHYLITKYSTDSGSISEKKVITYK